jgi:hypothetical protein
MVELRSGPKSYTFGGFVKLLELYYDIPDTNKSSGISEEASEWNGMEDFLNYCETEAGMEGTDMYEKELGDEEAGETDDIEKDCLALKQFLGSIMKAKDAFNLKDNEEDRVSTGPVSLNNHHCSILIKSELSTLSLYERAINLILSRFKKKKKPITKTEGDMISDHALDLANAFFQIRYPYNDL